MARVIVYTMPNGDVRVCVPAADTDEQIAFVLGRDIPANATNIQIVDRANCPADRRFRDAWEQQGNGVGHNLAKARAIHMDRIRVARDKRLAALDVDYMRADERGQPAEKARIAAEKQRLRDLPATFDLSGAADVNALDALWPADLPR